MDERAIQQWVPGELWEIAAPLIPPAPHRPQGGGRRRVDDRAVLAAILYLTESGCSWWKLPTAVFGVSRATAHRRFTEWTEVGLWPVLHRAVLDRPNAAGRLGWDRAVVDSLAVRAEKGGADRPRPGRPRQARRQDPPHERAGRDAAGLRDHRRHPPDHTMLLPLVDEVPPVRGRRGRPRRRPGKLHADKAYDVRRIRQGLTRRHIKIRIARRGVESSQRLGRHRWVIERSLSWLMRFRRLVRRYDRTAAHFAAFVTIACTLIGYQKLTK